ncbi:MAG: histidinol-phosphatase HisJ family protein [Candidatus Ozemobacteraceae bacterium]
MYTSAMIDVHCHSRYSNDSTSEPRDLIAAARAAGVLHFAITDHADFAPGDSCFSPDQYLRELAPLRGKCGDTHVSIGVELGIQVGHADRIKAFLGDHPFDMIIASMHRVREQDIGVPEWGRGVPVEESWSIYFRDALDSVRACPNFDVFGHLDIPRRYGATKGTSAGGSSLKDLDALLSWLIKEEKTLEVNTSGYRYGLSSFHPQKWVMDRYFHLGGRRVTVGSDAHTVDQVGTRVAEALSLLRSIGFTHVQAFTSRRGESFPLAGAGE